MHRIAKIPLVAGPIMGGIGLSATGSAQAPPGILVKPGQSIQVALDQAAGSLITPISYGRPSTAAGISSCGAGR